MGAQHKQRDPRGHAHPRSSPAANAAVYQENSPQRIYFLMLFHIFSEFLEDISNDVLPNDLTGYRESEVWQRLYNFQRDAATGIADLDSAQQRLIHIPCGWTKLHRDEQHAQLPRISVFGGGEGFKTTYHECLRWVESRQPALRGLR